jgi:hypothetical protein
MFALGLLTYFLVPKGTVTTSSALYPYYTRAELTDISDLIVEVKVEKIADSFYANPDFKLGEEISNVIVTDTSARIETVYKGDASSGDLITIRKEGGRVGNEEYISEEVPNFQVGDRMIIFLSFPRGGEKSEIVSYDYYGFHPIQGVYFPIDGAEGGETFKAYGTDETLNSSTLQEEIDALLNTEKSEKSEKTEETEE